MAESISPLKTSSLKRLVSHQRAPFVGCEQGLSVVVRRFRRTALIKKEKAYVESGA